MGYTDFVKLTRTAVQMDGGLVMHRVKGVFDTDANGKVDFDPYKYVQSPIDVLPGPCVRYNQATGTLTISGVVIDAETVTLNTTVYEFDTDGVVGSGKVKVDISASAAKAQGTLTFSGDVADGETVTVGGKVFEFDNNNSVTGTNIQVFIGTSLNCTAAILELVKAINAQSACTVTAQYATATTMKVFAKKGGTAGNSIASTETCANAAWGGATLASGTDCTALNAGPALLAAMKAKQGNLFYIEPGVSAAVIKVTAKLPGTAPNAYASTETMANGAWGGATLASGSAVVETYLAFYDRINKKLQILGDEHVVFIGGKDIKGSGNTDQENTDQSSLPTNAAVVNAAQAVAAGAYTAGSFTNPDQGRNVCIVINNPTGGALNLYEGISTFTITGTFNGKAQTDTITFTSTAGNKAVGATNKCRYKYGVKPFDTVTACTVDNVPANGLTISVGIGSKFGLYNLPSGSSETSIVKITKTAADLAVTGTYDSTNNTVNLGTLVDNNDFQIAYKCPGICTPSTSRTKVECVITVMGTK